MGVVESNHELHDKAVSLAMGHWEYIEKTLRLHGVDSEDELKVIGYHYRTAMIHGYGHGFEDCASEHNAMEGA